MIPKIFQNGDEAIHHFPGEGQIWVEESKGNQMKPYTFNVVFEPEATQEDIIEHSGITRLIDMGIDGFSTTVFCYGQTGSGKTHTLTGPPHLEKLFTNSRRNPAKHISVDKNMMNKDHGLVFRSFIYLFQQLESRKDDATFVIKASYLEIYNEKVLDLLNPGVKKSNLSEGLKNRAIGTHNMNEHSSRSHTILTVHIHSEEKASSDDNKGVYITRHGKINFVDLAGSEMTKKTKSEGKTLEEANNINKSLMVLGYCIAQLSSSKRNDKGQHIPYRDSKLTKLLADSLAGNGVTLMIACVSPAKSNMSESSNTLRYAARAKRIKTKPVVVMDPREALIVSLKREVAIMQQENDHLRQLVELAESDSNSQSFTPDIRQQIVMNGGGLGLGGPADGRATPATKKKIDKKRLNELDSSTLVELIKDYMVENQALRRENNDLFSVRDMMLRDQELVCRENERLLRKLEDVNSVCCRSPIIPARPSYSAELMSLSYSGSLPRSSGSAPDLSSVPDGGPASPITDIWTNPLNMEGGTDDEGRRVRSLTPSRSTGSTTPTRRPHRLPDNLNRELEMRKIGSGAPQISEGLRNNKSGKSSGESEGSPDIPPITRRKPGQLSDGFVSVRRRSLSTSGSMEEKNGKDARKGNIRRERAKKLKGQSSSRERIN
ncbi:kinesin-like protein KIF12 [Eurytemora carolleeae]|uniref:kinesin-like protein KIF12 n=1 Tax=Eurytemora carolleeae TaxID=1294199 RepID=UPI000C77A665|nr:kinesin-like protein KIF12 [Eurytemora carolleeae]|eukprot:XP_023345915.1 kinesin-like protein KIF12 [Eurytemora affinis]